MLPTSTRVLIDTKRRIAADVQAVVAFIAEGGVICGDAPHLLDEIITASLQRLLKAGVIHGKSGEVAFDLLDDTRRAFLVGVGNARKLDAEAVRRAAGALARGAKKHKLERIAIVPPMLADPESAATEALVSGFLLASFEYTEYHGTAKADETSTRAAATRLTILATERSQQDVKAQVRRGQIIADAQNFCRTIAHRPGNVINPPVLARIAQDAAKEVGLIAKVLDEKQMAKLGMGGILAVGAGSIQTPPRLIALEHRVGPATQPPLLIVGKAITFDTGGISIKPAEKMGSMVFDKCGAMAVLGLMVALAKLKTPINVVGLLSSAENHISSAAYRPGDILRMYNGVTVQVTNTDAEGRLVLADALAWGIETYKPSAVVDLATLTGGVVVALGTTMAGVMGNDDALCNELIAVGKTCGEQIWRLPLGQDQRDQIKSDDADIVNSAGRWASPLQGAAFLSHFVPSDASVPWAHLDIAGVSDSDKDLPYYRKGATGWGVRTLVEWITQRATRGPASRPTARRGRQ